jgi:SAM-dependent methyltransferase
MIDQPSQFPIANIHYIRIQDRAFRVGHVIGVNAFRTNRESLKRRLVEGGYELQETPHLLYCRRPGQSGIQEVQRERETSEEPIMLVHRFAPEDINSDLGHFIMEELKPLGLVSDTRAYGNIFGAIIGSLFPTDNRRAWHLYATNTLQRYHQRIEEHDSKPRDDHPGEVFAALYRRACQLCLGTSLLDAGCSSGFLPLIVAERVPTLTRVVGIDIYDAPFPVARKLAEERHLPHVRFQQADLLAESTAALPYFDTVTALHVLEHFTGTDMYRILATLLKLTARRLILAVPYESGQPEPAYGHQQLFTSAKLEAVGRWCIRQWNGGKMSYEDCVGGLLWVDRGA